MQVGDEARKHCRKQKMNYPVDDIGIVRSWEDMKHLWDYAFGETKLNVDPKACKVSYERKILNKLYNIHDNQVRISNSSQSFKIKFPRNFVIVDTPSRTICDLLIPW